MIEIALGLFCEVYVKKTWLMCVLLLVGCKQQNVIKREQHKAREMVSRIKHQYESLFKLAKHTQGYQDRMQRRALQDDLKELVGTRNYEYRQRGFLHRIDPVAHYPFVQVEHEVADSFTWLKKKITKEPDEIEREKMEKVFSNLCLVHRLIRLHPLYRKELRQYQDYTIIGHETNATGIEIEELKRSVWEDERGTS